METRYGDVEISLADHVATAEIQRPPNNFFDTALIQSLADAFEALDEDMDCRAIVLAADGKHFCAGANFHSGQAERDLRDVETAIALRSSRASVFLQKAGGWRDPGRGYWRAALASHCNRISACSARKRALRQTLSNSVFIRALPDLYPAPSDRRAARKPDLSNRQEGRRRGGP